MTLSLHALSASKGIAIGRIYSFDASQLDIAEYQIQKSDVNEEIKRFRKAIRLARKQLKAIKRAIPDDTSVEISSFIDTHLLMLKDSALTKAPENNIRSRHCNAEWALKLQQDELVNIFDGMEDPYLRTRRDDVEHVVMRVQRILLRKNKEVIEASINSLKGYVVLADDLTAADIIQLKDQGISGFITKYGGASSHAAILARSLRIPAIVGLHEARLFLHDEDEVILDGRAGVLLADFDKRILRYYQQLSIRIKGRHKARKKLRSEKACTQDNVDVRLYANIELPSDIDEVRKVKATGVGLFRTEFIFMNRETAPDEEEQFIAYKSVVKALEGQDITIRTLDIGADKPARTERLVNHCVNPALGLRAIRMCLKELSLFKVQLRAIIRASAFGNIRLLLPMLSNLQEVSQTLHLIDTIQQDFLEQGIMFDKEMKVGAMVEVPSVAICADMFASKLDFFSIGTNDLIQYTIAADRVDDEVNYLYDPLHPAVLRLIKMTLDAGNNAGIPVSMCGEMAANARYTRLLLGLGLREFSVPPNTLLEIKQIINNSNTDELAPWAHRVMHSLEGHIQAGMVDRLNSFRDG